MKKYLFFVVFALSACSQFESFEDMRREAGQTETVGQSSDDFPAICYNPLWHNDEDLQKQADQACARTNRKAIFQHRTAFSCRLVNPSTSFYKCQ